MLERLTFKVWPDRPKDYSLETVDVRWDAMKAVYQAERIREFNSAGNPAKAS